MRRSCKGVAQLAVYRSLDFAARAAVDAHLRECPVCAARLIGYERVDQSLQMLPEVRPPARLQQPWPKQMAARGAATSDHPSHHGSGWVVGKVLLPASLIIGLVVGLWLLVASLTGGDSHLAVTPTLTLTPTATVAALLRQDNAVEVRQSPSAVRLPRAAVVLPTPLPTLIVSQFGPAAALRTP